MSAQLTRLLEAGRTPRTTIQILPLEAYSTTGLAGGFAIAQAHGVFDTAYVESAGVMSRVTERSEDVSVLSYRYEGIRSEALPQRESLEVIKETLKRWTN
ncbi:Scr1 family TA system antitoxin-like transcriptional regulator [Nonomuraea rhizosphaerae]|uniref:Scr1 family TA system antitoxin-like transcriptional regulator n=1 Tax=Nonomuraea rhizosphaerae TaxID=2665663 RepID=UPI001C5E2DE6